MILSISKKYNSFALSIILLAGFLASCSHQKKIISTAPIQLAREEAPKYLMGPEVPSKIFVDKTEEYGLKDVKAVHLYAVDVDRDGYTDRPENPKADYRSSHESKLPTSRRLEDGRSRAFLRRAEQ